MARTDKGERLTDRQRRFAHHYVRTHNGTKTALAVGCPNPKAAKERASKWLAQVAVRRLVDELEGRVLEKVDSKAEEVLAELRHVAMARLSRCIDGDRVMPLSEWGEHELAALGKIEVTDVDGGEAKTAGHVHRIELKDKARALELLAKHHRLLIDRVEVDDVRPAAFEELVLDAERMALQLRARAGTNGVVASPAPPPRPSDAEINVHTHGKNGATR